MVREAFPLVIGEAVASSTAFFTTRRSVETGQEEAARLAYDDFADAVLVPVDDAGNLQPGGLVRVMRCLVLNEDGLRETLVEQSDRALRAKDSPFDVRTQQRRFAEIYAELVPRLRQNFQTLKIGDVSAIEAGGVDTFGRG